MIEILYCLACRAFSEIVQTRNDHKTATGRIERETDVREIGVCYVLKLRESACLPDADHRPASVGFAEERFDAFSRLRFAQRHVDGGKNSARQRKQMRGEDHLRFRQAGMFCNLGRMAMRKKTVGLEIFIELGKLQIAPQLFARAGRAGFAITNNT